VYADPDYELSTEWVATKQRIDEAQRRWDDPSTPSRVLLICGSARNDGTCPGEMSKTFRLLGLARQVLEQADIQADVLDLSLLTSDYGRHIHPCKGCVSTAMPLCHWPCSCYPNHSLDQIHDWMAEIYERWTAAHAVLIVTPVYWYQSPSPLKLMIDRLVCADGGNPDPTTTRGKDPEKAKALELAGWPYPRHLAGRAFAVVAHGDTQGHEDLRRSLSQWLTDIGMSQAGDSAAFDTLIGYYEPYATSHDKLDASADILVEVENAARSLAQRVRDIRSGQYRAPDSGLRHPRQK